MKKLYTTLILFILTIGLFAQSGTVNLKYPTIVPALRVGGSAKVRLDSIVQNADTIKFFTGGTELKSNGAGIWTGTGIRLDTTLARVTLGINNVTNESKATMFASPIFTTQVTLPAITYIPSAGVLNFNSNDVTLTHGSNVLTLAGGNLALGANNLTMTGSIGATEGRVTKGWFDEIEVTNLITLPQFLTPLDSAITQLGSSLKPIHSLWLTPNSPIYFGFPGGAYFQGFDNRIWSHGDFTIVGDLGSYSQYVNRAYIDTLSNNYTLSTYISSNGIYADTYTGARVGTSTISRIPNGYFTNLYIHNLPTTTTNDTLSTMEYVRTNSGVGKVAYTDSLTIYATPSQISDTITDLITNASLGVALADSNVYDGGYTTRTYVESLLGSGSGLSAKRLPFIVDITSGAPSSSDSIVVHSEFEGKHIDLYRDGAKQYQNFTATNTVEGFRVNGSTITVNPVWQANEQVMVDIIEPILWSYLSLEGQESTLLTGLNGYWKLDESFGTTAVDVTGTENGSTTATVNVVGKLGRAYEYDAASDITIIPYNTNVTPKGTAFSVSIWFNIDSLPTVTGRGNYLMQIGHNASPYLSHSIEVDNSDNKITVRSRNASGTLYEVRSTSAIAVDTWYHLVFVNAGDGEALKIYLNGSDVTASSVTFTGTIFEGLATNNINFGNAYSGAPSSYLDGTLDSPAIWGRALTSGEVTILYNSTNGLTYPFN